VGKGRPTRGVHTIQLRAEFAASTGYVWNYDWLRLVLIHAVSDARAVPADR
jgi:hypothetical protein